MAEAMQIGPYEIIEKIATGGMGTVYRARQVEMRREIALKVLLPGLSDDQQFIARFRREAQAASQLKHPNIIEVYDLGEDNGMHYMAMEYIPNGSVQTRLRSLAAKNEHMSEPEAQRISRQVADALSYAHSKGFVHRDIKPSNILLRNDGSAILADFGIVLATAGTKLTHTVSAIGTPEYMSPEQAKGHDLDARSDIYSLGIVLYEMLAGSPPFKADAPISTAYKQINEPLPNISRVRKRVSFSTRRILERATLKAPRERFQSAQEMVKALDMALGDSQANLMSRIGVTAGLVRPTSENKAVRAVGALGGCMFRTVLILLLIAVLTTILVGGLVTFGGSLALERILGSYPWNWRYAFNGERFVPITDIRAALKLQLPAYTLNVVQFRDLIMEAPDKLNIAANVDRYVVAVTLRLDQNGDVPEMSIESIDGSPLPVIGPQLAQGINRGLATGWRNEKMRLQSIRVSSDGITTQAEALSGYDPALEPAMTATPYNWRPTATPAATPTPEPTLIPAAAKIPTPETVLRIWLWAEDFSSGSSHPDWITSSGTWKVLKNSEGQTVWQATGNTTAVQAWLNKPNWSDYVFESRVRIDSGGLDISVHDDSSRSYVVRLRAWSNIAIGRTDLDQFSQVLTTTKGLEPYIWYIVRIEIKQQRLTLFIDNDLIATYIFSTNPISSGGIGYYGDRNDKFEITNIRVQEL